MKMDQLRIAVMVWVWVICCGAAISWAAPTVVIPPGHPCNLFPTGQPVPLQVELKDFPAGQAQVTASIRDYFGQQVWTRTLSVTVQGGKSALLPLQIGVLPAGYYELHVEVPLPPASGKKSAASGQASFGVATMVHRTAAEARQGGYRFGLKLYQLGDIWWRRPLQWHLGEVVDACTGLGLQWTRQLFNQQNPKNLPGIMTVPDLAAHQMNVILKVERFPAELYDAQRYGPMGEWEKKSGKGAWTLKTLPREQDYKKWLRRQIASIPPDQNVFEIWNEPWDKLAPEDFATLSQWIVGVIHELRPDAIVGPNLTGDTSPYQYDARVIKAGGMKGMAMVALHPYGKSEDRAWLRAYRQWLHSQLGHDIDIYVTEFGSHSTPQGPAKRSEHEQAQRVVSQALALYVEGVKALTPHWMGQTELNPTYIEDWFGFFRLNGEPKPVLMAYANCARMVDASRYIGDLWYGPRLDAMLFERSGSYTLALDTRGEARDVTLRPGVDTLTLVDTVGAGKTLHTENGELRLHLTGDTVYLVGVSPDLAKQATRELNPQRWPEPARPPRTTRTIHQLSAPPAFDGSLDTWQPMTQLAMINPKVSGEDCSGMGYLGWDGQCLYVAVDMRDNEVLNKMPSAKLYQQDSLELFVSTEPRENHSGYGPHDYQFFITPSSADGKPVVGEVVDREAVKLAPVKDVKYQIGKTAHGWRAQVAIPWSTFADFQPALGAKLALEMRVNDADTSHPRFKIDPMDGNVAPADPTVWSYLVLEK